LASVTARIRTAGPLEVTSGDARFEPSDFPGRQGRVVFAALALAHGPVDRNELADILWPNRLPSSWTRDLSAVISKLRARFAGVADLVTGSGRWYSLELPDAEVDVEIAATAVDDAERARDRDDVNMALQHAECASAILSEPFLAGDDCPWVDERRAELRDLLARALVLRAELLSDTASPAALTAAQALVDLEPEREAAHVLLMRAQLALGNRVEALRTYERLRKLLADDFGLVPSAAADDLMRAALGPDDTPDAAPVAVPLPAPIVDARRTTIVGRAAELRRLDALLDGESGARLAAVLGPAGIGKSRLACEAASRAHERGAVVLYGACSEGPATPYGALIDAFASVRLLSGVDERSNRLAADVVGLLDAPDDTRTAARPQAELFAAVASAIDRFAGDRVLTMVVDDAHWADTASVRLIEQLLASVARLRVVLTARAGEVEHRDVAAVVARLQTKDAAIVVRLSGLALSDVEHALREQGAAALEPALVHEVHHATGGNPLYVREVGRHLAVTGPPAAIAGTPLLEAVGLPHGLAELIDANLARLGGATRRVLEVGAVVGGSIEVGVLLRACGMPERDLLAAVDVAQRAGVLVDAAGSDAALRFEHPLLREVLLVGLGRARRAQLHQRVAEAIEAFHHDDVDEFAAELAHHLAAAANVSSARDAIDFALRAGERADAVCAYEEAAHWFAHGLRLARSRDSGPPTISRLLIALGDAQNHAGDATVAQTTLLDAVDAARASREPEMFADAVLHLGGVLVDEGFEGGEVDERLVALLQEAIAGVADTSPRRARLSVRLAEELHFSGARDRCLALCDEAEAVARAIGDADTIAVVLGARHYTLYGTPDVAQRLALLTELQTLRTRPRADARWPRDYLELGDLEAVEAAAAHLERQIGAFRIASDRYYPAVIRATLAALRGDLADAEDAANEAVEVGRLGARGPGAVAGVWAAQLFSVRLFDGRLGELVEFVDAAADATASRPIWRAAAAFMHLELNDVDGADAHFAHLRARGFARIPDTLDRPMTLALLSWVAAQLGTAADARALRRMLLPYRDLFVVLGAAAPSVCAGPAAYPLGMLEARLGNHDVADALLAQAERATTAAGAAPWRDRIRRDRRRVTQTAAAATSR
jgi:DNA-binding SARP family transcriptional activator